MRRLARINGRTDDMLIIRGVNVFPSQIEEIILKQEVFDSNYLLEVSNEAHMDALAVFVEWRSASHDGVSPTGAASKLAHDVKALVGITITVKICETGFLDRSTGKAHRVIDRRRHSDKLKSR